MLKLKYNHGYTLHPKKTYTFSVVAMTVENTRAWLILGVANLGGYIQRMRNYASGCFFQAEDQ